MEHIEIILKRAYKGEKYTIGHLYARTTNNSLERLKMPYKGALVGIDTLEDRDRCLSDDMDISKIKQIKIKNETAIPYGKYNITTAIKSPTFESKTYYDIVCKLLGIHMPRLENVKGFDGILIHRGTNIDHTSGCILVGRNTIKGGLSASKVAFEYLMNNYFSKYNCIISIE